MSRLDCSAGASGTMTTMRTRYHFSGVGGAGMSPLARLMRARGHAVQGSDRAFDAGKNREAADTLRAAGVELVPHDGSGITGVIDHFVFSTAVEAETPEMRAARARGLAMLARPALLAELVDTGRPGVAVSGTSGKSTITGMVAWLAREAGAVASGIGGAAGVGAGADAPVTPRSLGPARATGVLRWRGSDVGLDVPQPGLHNLENAAAAALVGLELGIRPADVERLLPRFPGVARRFETIGVTGTGIRIIDDFAHNGEKIRAALTTAQAGAPRVVAVFQPHGFGPARFLRGELRELIPSLLRPSDRFCYAEIFYAGGSVTRDLSSRDLAADIGCAYAEDHAAVTRWVAGEARPGDTILLMGARDPELPRLARRVLAALG